jgi:hypothetical protein
MTRAGHLKLFRMVKSERVQRVRRMACMEKTNLFRIVVGNALVK